MFPFFFEGGVFLYGGCWSGCGPAGGPALGGLNQMPARAGIVSPGGDTHVSHRADGVTKLGTGINVLRSPAAPGSAAPL